MTNAWNRFDYDILLPLISRFPPSLAYRMAEWRGSWIYRAREESRQHAIENVRRALTVLSEREVRAVVRRHYQTLSVDEMESFWFEKDSEFFRRNLVIEGLETLQQSAGRPGGAILMIGHWGSPGTLIVALGKNGIPFNVAVRPIERDEDALHPAQLQYAKKRLADIERAIQRPILYTGQGKFPRMRELLRSGELIMLQLDVTPNILRHVQPALFFGRTAYFADGIVRLQQDTGARVFYCIILRMRKRPYQRIQIREITVTPSAKVTELLQQLVSLLEEEIRERPCQWTLWDSMSWFYQPPVVTGSRPGENRREGLADS
jgi:lauroyl/myristoyl acyltransferase